MASTSSAARRQSSSETDPTFAPAFLNLGVALAHTGRSADAVAHLDTALRLNPAYPEAHFNRGNVLKDLGCPADAEAAYRDAVRLRPDHPGAHNNLGLLLMNGGKPPEALEEFRQARDLPQHVAAEVEHQGVLFAGMQTKAATDHLVIKSRRHGRPQQGHAINVGRVKASRQHVDVDQVFQRLPFKEPIRWLAAETGQ